MPQQFEKKSILGKFLCLALSALSLNAWASRNWQTITVPGAMCGNGTPYKVYLDKKDSNNVSIELMGGGACWNFSTCYGPTPLAPVYIIPGIPSISALAVSNPARSPLSDSTFVYMPYCTGDVFSGTRTQQVELGAVVHKVGRINVELSLRYLGEMGLIEWNQVTSLQLLGSSAGAIGSLLHAPYVEAMIPASAKKSLILDSPGLHFGDQFWKQLGPHFTEDLFEHMKGLGIEPSNENANVAKFLPEICRSLSNWNIGFLQASKDIVMSALFGTTSPQEHERQVFGDEGLWRATAEKGDNCAAWVPSNVMHTFFSTPLTAGWETGGLSALDFARNVVSGKHQGNRTDRILTEPQ